MEEIDGVYSFIHSLYILANPFFEVVDFYMRIGDAGKEEPDNVKL